MCYRAYASLIRLSYAAIAADVRSPIPVCGLSWEANCCTVRVRGLCSGIAGKVLQLAPVSPTHVCLAIGPYSDVVVFGRSNYNVILPIVCPTKEDNSD